MIVVLAVLGIVLACLAANSFRYRNLLESLHGQEKMPNEAWCRAEAMLKDLAKRERLKHVKLWVIPDFSPNILMIKDFSGCLHLACTEGAMQALDAAELELLFLLALSRGRKPGYWLQSRAALSVFPVLQWLDELPQVFHFLFCAVLQFSFRPFASYRAIFHADAYAASRKSPHALAGLIQKISVAGRKTPLRSWNLAIDQLFLFSPLRLEKYPFWFFLSQPSVESRRNRLLRESH